jgi:hypothetical protein
VGKRPIRIQGSIAFIALTQCREAIIDSDDVVLVDGYNWFARRDRNTFYAITNSPCDAFGKRTTILLHRLLLNPPAGLLVDHIDGNGLNNRRANLRVATAAQNNCNQGIRSDNKSGHRGVVWSKKDKRWYARIRADGIQRHLGIFDRLEDAASAYRHASKKLHGEFGRCQ